MYSYKCILILSLAFLLSEVPDMVRSHGYMIKPAQRGSLWRTKGKESFPKNYDDNANNAGGPSAAWNGNIPMYGMCGDRGALSQPRPHETGGKFGLFPKLGKQATAQCYPQGSTIDVEIIITAHHQGYFDYQLCKLNSKSDTETEVCFQQTFLKAEGNYRWMLPNSGSGSYKHKLTLPQNVKCDGDDSHCVLRWHYTADNSQDALHQEEFWNCADIQIGNCSPSMEIDEMNLITSSNETIASSLSASASISESVMRAPISTEKLLCKSKKERFEDSVVGDAWCNRNCNHHEHLCPKEYCRCI